MAKLFKSIAVKLGLGFAAALIVFALAVGAVFTGLFKNYTLQLHKAQMQHTAQMIADNLSDGRGSGMMTGIYLRCISDITSGDVWIVDADKNLLTPSLPMGHGMMHHRRQYRMADLPPDAAGVIDQVMTGQTVFSEGFSDVLSQLTLTVGVPIKNHHGQIKGAVLLHSPVAGMNEAVSRGLLILASSLAIALAVAAVLASAFSYVFTRPLLKMKETALRLAKGDYKAQCKMERGDEIGELASALDTLSVRLDEAKRRSDALDKMRRDFTANVSHELRTPVTVIRGSLEALHDGIVTEPDKVRQYHEQMLSEAKFLERLVGDLLDLSRLQNADFKIEMHRAVLGDVISDVLRSAGRLAEAKQVKIHADIRCKDTCLLADYGRLRQMLMIVLDNAVKFSPENAVIDTTADENQIVIRDHGPGIDPQLLPHIFERFYKTRDERNKSGTGLGLAIAYQIARRHNIDVNAANCSDGGAKFTFTLPKK